jgi:hypothetical protein
MSSDPASFQVWRLDDLLATWSTLELSPDETDWLGKFQDRYLRLELSESDWKEHQPPPSAGAEPSATDPEHFDLPEQWREFKKWIGQNYEGFVLNEMSKIDFMLHRASCGTLLFGPNDSAVLKPKHCSTKKRVLIEWAEARSSVVPPTVRIALHDTPEATQQPRPARSTCPVAIRCLSTEKNPQR